MTVAHSVCHPDEHTLVRIPVLVLERFAVALILYLRTKPLPTSLLLHVYQSSLRCAVLFSAHSYNIEYLEDAFFDNKYITGYFYRIDERREKLVSQSLLYSVSLLWTTTTTSQPLINFAFLTNYPKIFVKED